MTRIEAQEKLLLSSRLAIIATGIALPLSIAGTNIFLPLAVVLAIAAGQFPQMLRVCRQNYIVWPILALIAFLWVSSFYSTGSWDSVLGSLHAYAKLLFIPLLLPLLADERWRERAISAFLWSITLILVLAFAKHFGLIHISINSADPTELFHNHIETSFMIALAAFFVALRASIRSRWRSWYWLWVICAIVVLFFLNSSRTGYLIAAVLLVLFLLQHLNKRGIVLGIITATMVLLFCYVFSPTFKQTIQLSYSDIASFFHETGQAKTSLALRLDFFQHSLHLIKQCWLLGHGAGSFESQYFKEFGGVAAMPGDRVTAPHNDYLLLAVEGGMVGLTLFLLIFLTQWRHSLTLEPPIIKYMAQGLIVAFVVGCWCDDLIYISSTGYTFVFFTAVLFS